MGGGDAWAPSWVSQGCGGLGGRRRRPPTSTEYESPVSRYPSLKPSFFSPGLLERVSRLHWKHVSASPLTIHTVQLHHALSTLSPLFPITQCDASNGAEQGYGFRDPFSKLPLHLGCTYAVPTDAAGSWSSVRVKAALFHTSRHVVLPNPLPDTGLPSAAESKQGVGGLSASVFLQKKFEEAEEENMPRGGSRSDERGDGLQL